MANGVFARRTIGRLSGRPVSTTSRKREKEGGAHARTALDPDPTTLRLDQMLRDVKTEAPPLLGALVGLPVPFKEVSDLLRSDARPRVPHRELKLFAGAGQRRS